MDASSEDASGYGDRIHSNITGSAQINLPNLGTSLDDAINPPAHPAPVTEAQLRRMTPTQMQAYMQPTVDLLALMEDKATWIQYDTALDREMTEAEGKARTLFWMDSTAALGHLMFTSKQEDAHKEMEGTGPVFPFTAYHFSVDVGRKVYALAFPATFTETLKFLEGIKGNESRLVTENDGSKHWVTTPVAQGFSGFFLTSWTLDPQPVDVGRAYVIHGTLPDTLAPLSGTASFAIKRWSGDMKGTVVMRYTLSPTPPVPAEFIIRSPYTIYDEWRPIPGMDEDTPAPENDLEIDWVVHLGAGNPASHLEVSRVTFRLGNVSRYPGVCMNWPEIPKSDPQTGEPPPDLRFKKDPDYSRDVLWDEDGLTLKISGETAKLAKGTERIQSFDGAATGELVGEAELSDGRILTGTVPGPGRRASRNKLLIPEHEEGVSDIAQSWRYDNAEPRTDEVDDENDPKGDGQVGDGLSVWEEYRGFMEGGEWTDCSPKKKDLFIDNRVGPAAEGGIDLFAKASGLEVHKKLTKFEHKIDRVINFNTRADRHVVDQHCLRISKSDDPNKGVAVPIAGARFTGPPKNTDWVYVLLGQPENLLFPDPTSPSGYSRRSRQTEHIAHELGHAVGMYHHGDRDPWTGGKYGVIWKKSFGGLGPPLFREGAPTNGFIKVLREPSLRQMDVAEIMGTATSLQVGVGYHFGQHSGDVDCIMRYDVAWAYELITDPAARVWHGESEPPGIKFCTSPGGTQFNLPTHDPQSRYGGADELRGDCAHQFVISDKYDIKFRDEQEQAASRSRPNRPAGP